MLAPPPLRIPGHAPVTKYSFVTVLLCYIAHRNADNWTQ